VCYECLKHSLIEMKVCSICHFALLCSEVCENQHIQYGCMVQIRQNQIFKMKKRLNEKYIIMKNSSDKSSHLVSKYSILSNTSKINSMLRIYLIFSSVVINIKLYVTTLNY